jgi:hypothetical protein
MLLEVDLVLSSSSSSTAGIVAFNLEKASNP